MKLSEMTWREIDQLDRSTVVVVPFGAMEQHGLHMPMCTDALIGETLASRLDTACSNRLLVLPMQWLGLSTHHMRFPGTITVSPETFIAMAFDILSSMARAGFRKFLILNSHGGNVSALDVVATKCKASFPENTFLTVTYWNAGWCGSCGASLIATGRYGPRMRTGDIVGHVRTPHPCPSRETGSRWRVAGVGLPVPKT